MKGLEYMEEQRKAGGKEFIFTLIWAVIVYLTGQALTSKMQNYRVIGGIIMLLAYCVIVFFVLTRYSSTFTYSVKNNRVKINRLIGKRNKEVDFDISNIVKIASANEKISAKNIYKMTPKIFSKKDLMRIVYNKSGFDEAVVFEPSKEMRSYITALMKKQGDNR